MLQFQNFLIERDIHHRAQKGGKAKDEDVFAWFSDYASKTLGNKLDIKSLLTLVSEAKTNPDSPLSFKRSPKRLFVENNKNEVSKQTYHEMLRMAAFSLAEVAKHPHMRDVIKHGFTVEVAGREIYPVSKDWTRQGVPLSSITGTGKTDLRFVDSQTGKVAATATMKRGAGQGLSAQPGEAMAVLTYTANKTMKETLGDRSRHPEEYAEVFGILAEFNTILRSTGNIKDKEKRDKAINKVKPQLQKLFDNLQDRPYLGVAWRKAIIREAMLGEGKFGQGSPGTPSFALGFGEEDAFFNTMDEYLTVSDADIINTPIYFTLPKTREGKYPVFRTGTIKKVKKQPEPDTETKPQPKVKAAPTKPTPNDSFAGGGDASWFSPGERDVHKIAEPEREYEAPIKRGEPSDEIRRQNTGAGARMAWIKGKPTEKRKDLKRNIVTSVKKVVRQKNQPAQKPTRPQIPWEKIQPHYMKGELSVDEIGKQFNVNPATIKWHAGLRGWRRGADQ